MASRKTQSGLADGLARRRGQPDATTSDPWDLLRQRASTSLAADAHQRTAEQLAGDIAVTLGSEIEELDTSHHGFRSALRRMFLRVLRLANDKQERVVLFHEAVPGYTLMLFKKDEWSTLGKVSPGAAEGLADSAEGRAAAVLMNEHVQRTGKRVLVVEHVDSLFVFFPAADLRRNVRELGYFAID